MIRIATLAGDPAMEAEIAGRISASTRFDLVLRCVERSEILALVRSAHVEVIVLAGLPVWMDRQIATEAGTAGIRLIGAAIGDDDAARMVSFGARPISPLSTADEIAEKCEAEPAVAALPVAAARATGRLVAVWGPKGAPGRSTVAMALGAEIADLGARSVLVDADIYGGDLLQMSGLVDELPGLLWATRMSAKEELDLETLLLELRRIAPGGPLLLPGIARPELWPDISSYGWSRLQTELLSWFEIVVCDAGFCLEPGTGFAGVSDRNELTRKILSSCDRVIACCRGDAVGLRQFLVVWDELLDIVPKERIDVIVNRCTETRGEIIDLLRSSTGKSPAAIIPLLGGPAGTVLRKGRKVLRPLARQVLV